MQEGLREERGRIMRALSREGTLHSGEGSASQDTSHAGEHQRSEHSARVGEPAATLSRLPRGSTPQKKKISLR